MLENISLRHETSHVRTGVASTLKLGVQLAGVLTNAIVLPPVRKRIYQIGLRYSGRLRYKKSTHLALPALQTTLLAM